MRHWFSVSLLVLGVALSGCGSGTPAEDRPIVVTADWLNRSITVFDRALLVQQGTDVRDAIIKTIDLSEWQPGPLELELTPDAKTAVVSVSPGFFTDVLINGLVGGPTVPDGGTLLIVDLDSAEVTQIMTADVPMGIAISSDGTRAYTANFGVDGARGRTMSIVDIPNRTRLEDITVGVGPEQVVLSDDGLVGAVNLASEDGVVVFETGDVAGTLSDVVPTGNDPSGLAFVGGSDRLLVANSQGFSLTLIDTSNPSVPVVLGSEDTPSGIPYGLTYSASLGSVLTPIGGFAVGLVSSLFVTTISPTGAISYSAPIQLSGSTFPLTAAVDSDGTYAFVAHLGDNQLSIVDLTLRTSRGVQWLSEPGPSYVAVSQ